MQTGFCGWLMPTGSAHCRTITACSSSAMSAHTPARCRIPPSSAAPAESAAGRRAWCWASRTSSVRITRSRRRECATRPGIATDGKVLAVADTDNNRILIWLSIPHSNGQPPDVVVGQKDFTHNATSVPPNATSLRGPIGVWIAGGKLYVADTQDNRVLIYNKIPTTNGVAADVVIGQPNFTSFVQPDLTQSSATPTASQHAGSDFGHDRCDPHVCG